METTRFEGYGRPSRNLGIRSSNPEQLIQDPASGGSRLILLWVFRGILKTQELQAVQWCIWELLWMDEIHFAPLGIEETP